MKQGKKKKIIGGAIGDCVHVAGIFEYLRIAEYYGHQTVFLGAAVAPEKMIEAVKAHKPDIVCISYRLDPSALESILNKLVEGLKSYELDKSIRYYFGGTPECIKKARQFNLFDFYFQGEESLSYIEKTLSVKHEVNGADFSKALVESRLGENYLDGGKNYYPLIRHHFGLPDLEKTIEGVKQIAESEQVDVISLAPDQNAQEYFFNNEKMDHSLSGSGGVPIRSEAELLTIREAAQRGNYPRLKIYSGTNNLLQWAEMSLRVLNIPWATLPLYWYSVLDGRSKRPLLAAIKENMETIRWYASRNIPVEINESHQWSLRECSDVMAIVNFYIAAYNAKKCGVKKYVAQFMFNTPRLTSSTMDLAKMLAKIEMIEELRDENFTYLKQVRAGLTHFSIDTDVAKGQLAASTLLALAIKPHIIHVVSFSEADHTARAEEVIESSKIVRGVLRNCWADFPDMTYNKAVQDRKNDLIMRAKKVIKQMTAVSGKDFEDPLNEPIFLESVVKNGIFDAPHLKGNSIALGQVKTKLYNGGYECVTAKGELIEDSDRIDRLLGEKGKIGAPKYNKKNDGNVDDDDK